MISVVYDTAVPYRLPGNRTEGRQTPRETPPNGSFCVPINRPVPLTSPAQDLTTPDCTSAGGRKCEHSNWGRFWPSPSGLCLYLGMPTRDRAETGLKMGNPLLTHKDDEQPFLLPKLLSLSLFLSFSILLSCSLVIWRTHTRSRPYRSTSWKLCNLHLFCLQNGYRLVHACHPVRIGIVGTACPAIVLAVRLTVGEQSLPTAQFIDFGRCVQLADAAMRGYRVLLTSRIYLAPPEKMAQAVAAKLHASKLKFSLRLFMHALQACIQQLASLCWLSRTSYCIIGKEEGVLFNEPHQEANSNPISRAESVPNEGFSATSVTSHSAG
ncbi:unnamed protein product [Protopolystoma xenopodis]|uniref:Uncharacterized protein n=1 Tax=Protopolystoma xenopodis TaxID=117903 RepID=A0A3S5BSS6_9PLAT|nr:unnamed protein product [Protopolystoma xenopodis]